MLKFLKETTEKVQKELKQDFKEREDGRNITMLLENKVKGKEHQQLAVENNLTRSRVSQLCSPLEKKLGQILPARETEIESCLDQILGRDNLLYLPEALAMPAQSRLSQEQLSQVTEAIRLYNFCTDRELYLVGEAFISRLKLAEVRELLAAKISKGGAGLTLKEVRQVLGSTGLSQAGLKALMASLRHYQLYEGRVYHALNKNEVAAVILWAYYPAGFSLKDSQEFQEFREIFEDFIQATGLNHSSRAMATLFKNKQQYAINIGDQVFIHKDHLEVNEEGLEEVRAAIIADLELMEETNIQRLLPKFQGRPGFEFIKSPTQFFAIIRDRFGDQFVFHNRDRILPAKMRGIKIKPKGQLIQEYIESQEGKVKQKKVFKYFAGQYGWHCSQVRKQVSGNDLIEIIRENLVKYLVIY